MAAVLCDLVDPVARPDPVRDLDPHGVPGVGLRHVHVVDLHRLNRQLYIGGVSRDVDPVPDLEAGGQIDARDRGQRAVRERRAPNGGSLLLVTRRAANI